MFKEYKLTYKKELTKSLHLVVTSKGNTCCVLNEPKMSPSRIPAGIVSKVPNDIYSGMTGVYIQTEDGSAAIHGANRMFITEVKGPYKAYPLLTLDELKTDAEGIINCCQTVSSRIANMHLIKSVTRYNGLHEEVRALLKEVNEYELAVNEMLHDTIMLHRKHLNGDNVDAAKLNRSESFLDLHHELTCPMDKHIHHIKEVSQHLSMCRETLKETHKTLG